MIYDEETIDEIQLHKGKYYNKKRSKTNGRVIAFDLDETLGSFTDLEILWSALQHFTKKYVPIDFNKLLDIYPEFLRYGILHIIEFLIQKKKSGQCKQIYIYTNNQCKYNWVDLISSYFDYKLKTNTPIFDKIIRAFRIGNTRIEPIEQVLQKLFLILLNVRFYPLKRRYVL